MALPHGTEGDMTANVEMRWLSDLAYTSAVTIMAVRASVRPATALQGSAAVVDGHAGLVATTRTW